METETTEVRGYTAYGRAPRPAALRAARLTDWIACFAIFCVVARAANFPPFTKLWVPLALAAFGWGAIRLQERFVGLTLGQRIWKMGAVGLGGALRQREKLEGAALASATGLTTLTALAAGVAAHFAIGSSPVWQSAEPWRLDPYHPPREESADWEYMPFFYTLGAWPRQFQGKPVFQSIPYEKGPPHHFAGRIVARWGWGDTRVTFEGPKTPSGGGSREAIQRCLSDANPLLCPAIRESALRRHVEEIQAINPGIWALKQFVVANPALPAREQTQGIYLQASNRLRGQERFIFLTAKGTHQAVILDYSQTAEGDSARELFELAVRTVRVSDDLRPGRAWVDQELARVELRKLESAISSLDGAPAQAGGEPPAGGAGDPAALRDAIGRLTEVSSLLMAKISVDPGSLDAYYHLGGVDLMMARLASRRDPTLWSAASLPVLQTIQSMQHFAQDIAPADPKTTGLKDIWLNAKKL